MVEQFWTMNSKKVSIWIKIRQNKYEIETQVFIEYI